MALQEALQCFCRGNLRRESRTLRISSRVTDAASLSSMNRRPFKRLRISSGATRLLLGSLRASSSACWSSRACGRRPARQVDANFCVPHVGNQPTREPVAIVENSILQVKEAGSFAGTERMDER